MSQAFLAWGDPAQYFLAADGDFASRTAWSLAGGAAVVPGGDGFSLAGAPASTASLALPAGSSATSPSNCLSVADPTLRFMARNVGDPASTLLVHANIVAPGGPVYTVPVGVMSAAATWNPGPIMGLLANVLAPSHGGTSTVSFTFTPLGAGGSWQIDDLHIDPWSFGG